MKEENLIKLQEKRDKLEKLKSEIKFKKDEYENSVQNLVSESKLTEADIESVMEEIKIEALAEYKTTGNKNLLGGVKVQDTNTIEYTADDAFNWAKEHSLCLMLDVKAFEDLAKTQKLDFVKKNSGNKVTFPKVIKFDE